MRDLSGPGRIRTYVGLRQRIYSPLPLAARAPTHRDLLLFTIGDYSQEANRKTPIFHIKNDTEIDNWRLINDNLPLWNGTFILLGG